MLGNPAGFLLRLEGFPRELRGRSLGIIYSVGVTLFGGFAPFVVTWLIGVTGSGYAPAWYMSACRLVSLVARPYSTSALPISDRSHRRFHPAIHNRRTK
ncbi:hypothetical protein HDG32_003029 [Paraburkholderia sp. CI2]|uniref:hypothetical protein n=1 Tax=Paraburkholderia sp. CI2 TaxID=2723093 RepID=UPI00160A3B4C|nr:hypothetical protein [Paraburkholderia sp. CI2]MBB5466909.1 hypothetical protein [Paraburkholderia sp. CI2]